MPAIHVPVNMPTSYEIRPGTGSDKALVLLLHGFSQRGAVVLEQLGDCFPPEVTVLAPDALFPFPRRLGTHFEMRFSWYFFDPGSGQYYTDMQPAAEFLAGLVKQLGFEHAPKWVVGYSQGGYMAPFAGKLMPGVRQVIGVNSRFRSEVLHEVLPFPLDAIHGAADSMVDPIRSEACFHELQDLGNTGQFHLIPGGGHDVTPELCSKLREVWTGPA